MSKIRYEVSAATLKGRRDKNQDMMYVNGLFTQDCDAKKLLMEKEFTIDTDNQQVQCFAVCDGAGGAGKGEIASLAATRSLDAWIEEQNGCVSKEDILNSFDRFNKDVIQVSRDSHIFSATTMTSLLISGEHFYLANIGDSPAFLIHKEPAANIFNKIFRKEKMETIFERQTVAEHVKNEMHCEPNPIDEHMLLSFLGNRGADAGSEVNIISGDINDGDIFVICSDGLTDVMPIKKIDSRMSSWLWDAGNIVNELEDKLSDNCTFIRIRIHKESRDG